MSEKREMIPPRRVRILESKYIEKSDLIQWTLHFLDDGLDQTYVWPSIDLLKALNIKRAEIDISDLKKFCREIEGKEINFVIDKEPVLPEPLITTDEDEMLRDRIRDHFDTFQKIVEERDVV